MAYVYGDNSVYDERTKGYDSSSLSANFQVNLGKVSFGKLSATDLTDWYQLNLDGPGTYTLVVSTDIVNNYSATNEWRETYSGIEVKITDGAGNPLAGLDTSYASMTTDGSIVFNYTGGYSHGDFFVRISNLSYAATDYILGLNLAVPGKNIYGTSGNDYLQGTVGDDNIAAGAGNDTIVSSAGNDMVDGGSGLDFLLLAGKMGDYAINGTTTSFTVKDTVGKDGADAVSQVERLIFTDAALAFDIDGAAGQAYRLYQAAFGRKPDMAGLGYWIDRMDHGVSLTQVAAGFFQSAEFQKLYGSFPSTTTLITNFYQNVLHRAPDQAGFDYWSNQLNKGMISPAGALASFCESAENQAQVIGQIQNGVVYTEWLG
ncbi:MAG: DUF4214 domain-containing protein [Burkholderiales bacterium]|nr:DUF4214 domain-containing protein [Burkholderiales bacterium]MBI3728899.1 DUF4214 domain-containing protein [Burkholderiales bacterium]